MLNRRHIGLAAAVAGSAILGTALPTLAAHADATTLYVNNAPSANCSDSGTGSQAQPFCTVQAAANAAQPGQTVLLAQYSNYPEQVTVTHSGTPGHPITFKGENSHNAADASAQVGVDAGAANAQSLPHGFVFSGVHDVTVSGLYFDTPQEGVLVQDSDRIVVDGDMFEGAGRQAAPFPGMAPAVRLTGKTTASTVSRNRIFAPAAAGVAVDAGVTGAVVTTNMITGLGQSAGIVVTDAPGTVVTGNSIAQDCQAAITLAGNSANSTVENNVVTARYRTTNCTRQSNIVVSDASTAGTKLDYNVVPTIPVVEPSPRPYSWGSQTYDSPVSLTTATGQGAHDLISNVGYGLASESVATDSADANAPGELATDIDGNPRVDDWNVANSGTGPGYYDRGAVELQDPLAVYVSGQFSSTPGHPLDAAVSWTISGSWGPGATTLDFGDGSPKLTWASGSSSSIQHTYPAAGEYTVTLSVTDGAGTSRTATTKVVIPAVDDVRAAFTASQPDYNIPSVTITDGSSSGWPIATYAFDFGDGHSSTSSGPDRPAPVTHRYDAPGQYTITETVTDDHGRTAKTSYNLYVGAVYHRVIEAVEGGQLHEVYSAADGWHDGLIPTGGNMSAMSSTYNDAGARVIEAVEGGVLHEIYSAADGWHDNPIQGAGGNISALSFSYSPSGARVIEAIEGGVLHEIYSAADGWHDNAIDGVAPNVSAMSFSYSPSGARVIEAIEGGQPHEIYSAADGWHDGVVNSGAVNVSALSFVYSPSGQRVIEAVEDGKLHEIYSAADGWHDGAVPVYAGRISNLSVKIMPSGERVIEAAQENMLHEIYSYTGNWANSLLPGSPTNVSAVSLNLRIF